MEKYLEKLLITKAWSDTAAAAFDAREELDGHVARYAANRAILLEALPRLGIERLAPPDGAFYVYADVSPWTGDSVAFCADLLQATGVAITPGVDFDPARGRSFARFSSAAATNNHDAAVQVPGTG